jgi:hypothetical protein
MVVHLGQILEIPPRELNVLLMSAGLAPAHRETPLDDLDQISTVLDFILAAHEPNMAIVVDRGWDVIRANRSASLLTARLLGEPPPWAGPRPNVMRLNFHPDGLRRHMPEWERSAAALLRRLERDVAMYPNDRRLQELAEEVRGYPGVESLPPRSELPTAEDLLVPMAYAIGGARVELFTTIATIGDAHDLTLAELRIETFWPMDDKSRRTWTDVTRALT